MNEETGKPYLPVYYGARMYDPVLLTWNSIDPLCENYYNISPYAYCANSPAMYIDPTGMDYWSTDDPNVISEFLNNLKTFGFSNLDYKEWHHTTDADFLANLSYNDQTNKYYYSRGTIEKGEVVCYSKTFTGRVVDSKWWSVIGLTNTKFGTVTGGVEYYLNNSIMEANQYTFRDLKGNRINSLAPKVYFPHVTHEFSVKSVERLSKTMKGLGVVSSLVSAGMTGYEIKQGKKNIIGEGGLDLIMTGVGFYGPYGWLISGGYFIGKYVLEDNNLDFWKK